MSLNQVQLIGHLGADPESRVMPNGDAVANFTLATSERWKDKNTGAQQEKTEWHRIVFYGRPAEIAAEYLRKGSLVFVQGRLQTRSWEQDGIKRYTTEIIGQSLKMLGGPRSDDDRGAQPGGSGSASAPRSHSQDSAARAQPAHTAQPGFDNFDDDIPF